ARRVADDQEPLREAGQPLVPAAHGSGQAMARCWLQRLAADDGLMDLVRKLECRRGSSEPGWVPRRMAAAIAGKPDLQSATLDDLGHGPPSIVVGRSVHHRESTAERVALDLEDAARVADLHIQRLLDRTSEAQLFEPGGRARTTPRGV